MVQAASVFSGLYQKMDVSFFLNIEDLVQAACVLLGLYQRIVRKGNWQIFFQIFELKLIQAASVLSSLNE